MTLQEGYAMEKAETDSLTTIWEWQLSINKTGSQPNLPYGKHGLKGEVAFVW